MQRKKRSRLASQGQWSKETEKVELWMEEIKSARCQGDPEKVE